MTPRLKSGVSGNSTLEVDWYSVERYSGITVIYFTFPLVSFVVSEQLF